MPRVSICIPNRNYGRFLRAAIESALAQTERDIEVVVIDDQSTDDSVKIAHSFDDPRVRVIALEKNIGLIANFNRCIAEARSPYVKLLCSDDLLHPECIERLAGALDRFGDATIAFSDREMLFNDGSRRPMISSLPGNCRIDAGQLVKTSRLVFNCVGEPTTVMIRKEACESITFDRRYVQAPDWQYFLQAVNLGPMVRVPEILSVFRWHETNASWSLKRNGTSVHDFLLLSEEYESPAHRKYPWAHRSVLRKVRFFCVARAVQMMLRNVVRKDVLAARRCWFLARRALFDLMRPWNPNRTVPVDF
jgi:glycosyltransferase involved in cell wall biosynthesis